MSSLYVKIAGGVVVLILVVLYALTLIPTENPYRTNKVFVYDALENSVVRAIVCNCRTTAEPLAWEGYIEVDGALVPHKTKSLQGKVIALSAPELKAIDQYKNVPKEHQRKQVRIGKEQMWVYIKN